MVGLKSESILNQERDTTAYKIVKKEFQKFSKNGVTIAFPKNTFYKEHPLNKYEGIEDSRDWIFESKESVKSFFSYWKKCKKELKIKNIIK